MILEIIALLIIRFAKMTTRIDAAGMLWSTIETLTHHCNHFASQPELCVLLAYRFAVISGERCPRLLVLPCLSSLFAL